jgi:hypothetical protein
MHIKESLNTIHGKYHQLLLILINKTYIGDKFQVYTQIQGEFAQTQTFVIYIAYKY